MKRILVCVAVLGLLSGCAMMREGADEAYSETTRTMKMKSGGYGDGTEELDEDWTFVGEEGRADMEKEKEPDRMWWNFVMSEKARSIERNVGIY